MSVESVLEKIKGVHTMEKIAAEGEANYDFFPQDFGAEKLADLVKEFDFKEDDAKWTSLYAQKKPRASYDKTRQARLRIAFLQSGLRDIRAFYMSGEEDTSFTDVDAMRLAAHYVNTSDKRLEDIKLRLKESGS